MKKSLLEKGISERHQCGPHMSTPVIRPFAALPEISSNNRNQPVDNGTVLLSVVKRA